MHRSVARPSEALFCIHSPGGVYIYPPGANGRIQRKCMRIVEHIPLSLSMGLKRRLDPAFTLRKIHMSHHKRLLEIGGCSLGVSTWKPEKTSDLIVR